MIFSVERELELEMLNAGEPPEVWVTCHDCCGEGEFVVNDPPVSRWSIDPPGTHEVTCETCGGAGGWIEEAS